MPDPNVCVGCGAKEERMYAVAQLDHSPHVPVCLRCMVRAAKELSYDHWLRTTNRRNGTVTEEQGKDV